MWDSCNGNAIKATKANLKDYFEYMKNISSSKSHLANTYSREVSTYKMGLELREDHFHHLDLHGIYADDLGWTQAEKSKQVILPKTKNTFSESKKPLWKKSSENFRQKFQPQASYYEKSSQKESPSHLLSKNGCNSNHSFLHCFSIRSSLCKIRSWFSACLCGIILFLK